MPIHMLVLIYFYGEHIYLISIPYRISSLQNNEYLNMSDLLVYVAMGVNTFSQ